MQSLQIQLHVLAEELVDWVEEWQEQFSLCIATVSYWPEYRLRPVEDLSALRSDVRSGRAPDEIWMSTKPFNFKPKTVERLEKANSASFFISFPTCRQGHLCEALMGAASRDKTAWQLWKRIAGIIKGRCHKGMWLLNPTMGIKGYYKNARYTSRVAEAAKGGLVLLPIAGDNIMSIEEPR